METQEYGRKYVALRILKSIQEYLKYRIYPIP